MNDEASIAPRPRDFPARSLDLRASWAISSLKFVHTTAVNKLAGLTEAQARRTPLPTSPAMSPLGLVNKHLTAVLRQHVQIHIGGHDLPSLAPRRPRLRVPPRPARHDCRRAVAAFDDEWRSLSTLVASIWRARSSPTGIRTAPAACRRTRRQESARHLGHLDILRELIDGSTGE